jgi:hypothetical protein
MGGSLVLMARGEPHWSPFTHTHPPAAFCLETVVSRCRCGHCDKINNVNIMQFIYKNTVH